MIWWISQPSRADKERGEIAELQERSDWLTDLNFGFVGLTFMVGFSLKINEELIEFRIVYPDFFPEVPASIHPKEEGRLSNHQWGADGELCLEHRADNWSSDITGAMMIESAYRLLSGEADTTAPPVPTSHNMSIGQEVRSSTSRFLVSESVRAQFKGMLDGAHADIRFIDRWFDKTWFAQPTELLREGEKFWYESAFYSDDFPTVRNGKVLALRADQSLPQSLTFEKLQKLVAGGPLESWVTEWNGEQWLSIVLTKDDTVRLYMLLSKEGQVLNYKTIFIPTASQRLPSDYIDLGQKRVAIVGCGSVGSKVAISLARSGVGKFLLIDADLFYPGNINRNALDLRAVGANKAKAVGRAIMSVQSDADIVVRNIALGGMEASTSTGLAMERLAACDLIVDATADPTVFNLCSLVSRNEKKPMVWAQVYAGGVGGIVARVRPELDPPATIARAQIQKWYADRGVPWLEKEGVNYDLLPADQPPMIADDADVSVISAHLTRLIIDTLLRPTASTFPYSAYCIGLSKNWIFDAPFDTWPIIYSQDGTWGPTTEEGAVEKLTEFVAKIVPAIGNENAG